MDPVPCEKNRILIVDDEEMIRRVFTRLLQFEFPSVTIDTATNGLEAIKIFRAGHHALILMDLYMPVMNGERAFAEFEKLCAKENWVLPPVIFCTGYNAAPEVRKAATLNPMHLVLQKPIKNDALLEAIRSRFPVYIPSSLDAQQAEQPDGAL